MKKRWGQAAKLGGGSPAKTPSAKKGGIIGPAVLCQGGCGSAQSPTHTPWDLGALMVQGGKVKKRPPKWPPLRPVKRKHS